MINGTWTDTLSSRLSAFRSYAIANTIIQDVFILVDLREVSIAKHAWRDDRPEIESQTGPRRCDLHPDSCIALTKVIEVIAWLEPISQCHHDIERSQEEHEMKQGVVVCDRLFFVIVGFAAVGSWNLRSGFFIARYSQEFAAGRLG